MRRRVLKTSHAPLYRTETTQLESRQPILVETVSAPSFYVPETLHHKTQHIILYLCKRCTFFQNILNHILETNISAKASATTVTNHLSYPISSPTSMANKSLLQPPNRNGKRVARGSGFTVQRSCVGSIDEELLPVSQSEDKLSIRNEND